MVKILFDGQFWVSRFLLRLSLVGLLLFSLSGLIFGGVRFVSAQSDLRPTGYVNDYAGVLSEFEKNDLEEWLKKIHEQFGAEIAVVTVASLGDRDVEGFSLDLARSWGIGSGEKDDGLLILIAPKERAVRFEVGYGLEGYVTDVQSDWIIRNIMAPAFREGNYILGINNSIARIEDALSGLEPIPKSDLDYRESDFFYYAFIAFWFFFPLLGAWLGRSKSIWAGGVVGVSIGLLAWLIFSLAWFWIIALGIGGLVFDWIASNGKGGRGGGWWFGGSGGGFGGGGFGGFGGGGFGGGGASGRW